MSKASTAPDCLTARVNSRLLQENPKKVAELVEGGMATVQALTIVHISDTHCQDVTRLVPSGDILVHSGDFVNHGSRDMPELEKFLNWFDALPGFRHKVIVCGNHEFDLDKFSNDDLKKMLRCDDANNQARRQQHKTGGGSPACEWHLMDDSGCEIMGLKFYGSSWNGSSGQAWGMKRDKRSAKWAQIPYDLDVLVTHMPPMGILDLAWTRRHDLSGADCPVCGKRHAPNYNHWGCEHLASAVQERSIPLHLFGHVHDENGVEIVGKTVYSNAAMGYDHTKAHVLVMSSVAMTRQKKQQQQLEDEQGEKTSEAKTAGVGATPSSVPTVRPTTMPRLAGGAFEIWATLQAPAVLDPSTHAVVKKARTLAIDLDTQDPQRRTIMVWKRNGRTNQQWVVVRIGPDRAPVYVIASADPVFAKETPGTRYLALAPTSSGGVTMVLAHQAEGLVPFSLEEVAAPVATTSSMSTPSYTLKATSVHQGGASDFRCCIDTQNRVLNVSPTSDPTPPNSCGQFELSWAHE